MLEDLVIRLKSVVGNIATITIILAVIAIVGIFGNLNVVWASFRKKSLRSICNILITITAIADILHQSGHLIWAYIYFKDIKITLHQCFHIQNIPLSAAHVGCVMLLIIAIDRVFCMTRAGIYQRLNKPCYIFTLLIFVAILPISLDYYAYNRMLLNKTQPVTCMIAAGYDDASQVLLFNVYLLLSILTLLAYGLIWLIVKLKNYSKSKQLLRSITVVSLCVVGGWFISMAILNMMSIFGTRVTQLNTMYAGIPLNLSVTLNYFIYFVMSREYRQAFIEQLEILTCGCVSCRSSKIANSHGYSTRHSVNSRIDSL